MKQINKASTRTELVTKVKDLLKTCTRTEVIDLKYGFVTYDSDRKRIFHESKRDLGKAGDPDEIVEITYDGGAKSYVSIQADSGLSAIRDILKVIE